MLKIFLFSDFTVKLYILLFCEKSQIGLWEKTVTWSLRKKNMFVHNFSNVGQNIL